MKKFVMSGLTGGDGMGEGFLDGLSFRIPPGQKFPIGIIFIRLGRVPDPYNGIIGLNDSAPGIRDNNSDGKGLQDTGEFLSGLEELFGLLDSPFAFFEEGVFLPESGVNRNF